MNQLKLPPPAASQAPASTQVVYVPQPSRGFAVTALVCGIIGCVIGLIPIFGVFALALGLIALVFGLLGARKAKQQHQPRGLARAGWILGVFAVALGVLGMAIVSDAFNELDDDLDELEQELNEP